MGCEKVSVLTASKEASMALSDHGQYSGVVDIARNGIDEVIRLQTQAKQDTELIRQLVAALEGYRRNHNDTQPCDAERAGRARLEGK